MRKILITRFPLESAWGGEEELHLLMAKLWRKNGIAGELISSAPELKQAFQENDFTTFSEFQKDITSKKSLIFSILFAPLFVLRGIFWVLYFRFIRKVDAILMLTLIEKICWTPLARLFGITVYWGHHAPLGKWFFQNPYLPLWRLWLKIFAIKIMVPSKFLAAELRAVVPKPEQVVVLQNAFDPSKFFVQTSNISVRESLARIITEKTGKIRELKYFFLVGTANRLSPEKGMEQVLRATQDLKQRGYQNILFLAAGTGPLQNELQKKAKELELQENFLFLGFLENSELALFYEALDLFLLASRHEPFGIALLEAMYFQKAIAASNIDGIPEVLGETNSGLFDPENPEALANKIEEFARDHKLLQQCQQENFQRFEKHFSLAAFEQKLLHTFCAQN